MKNKQETAAKNVLSTARMVIANPCELHVLDSVVNDHARLARAVLTPTVEEGNTIKSRFVTYSPVTGQNAAQKKRMEAFSPQPRQPLSISRGDVAADSVVSSDAPNVSTTLTDDSDVYVETVAMPDVVVVDGEKEVIQSDESYEQDEVSEKSASFVDGGLRNAIKKAKASNPTAKGKRK